MSLRGEESYKDKHEESYVKMKVGRGWSYLAITQGPQEAGRQKEGFSPRAFRGCMALLTLYFQISSFYNCTRINFCVSNW